MTLQELITKIDALPREELDIIAEHISQKQLLAKIQDIYAAEEATHTPPENKNLQALEQAFAKIRQDISKDEFRDIEEAMNAEYIEQVEQV